MNTQSPSTIYALENQHDFLVHIINNKVESVKEFIKENHFRKDDYVIVGSLIAEHYNHQEIIGLLSYNIVKNGYKESALKEVIADCYWDERLDLIKVILQTQDKTKPLQHILVNKIFNYACKEGNKNIIDFLCDNGYTQMMNAKNGFELACKNAKVNLVQYFLSFANNEFFYDMLKMNNGYLSKTIGENKSLEYIKFMLEDPQCKNIVKIHQQDDYYVSTLCDKANDNPSDENYWDVLHYLIFDYGIKKTSVIKVITKEYPEIKKLFSVRHVNNKLNTDLVDKEELPNNLTIVKNKI